jgi:hypothetical protein
MAVAASAHALFEVVRLQEIAPVVAAELTALIRMNHDGLLWLTAPDWDVSGILCGGAGFHS